MGLAVAVTLGGWVWAAGPAAAHDTTPTTAPAAPAVATGMSGMGGMPVVLGATSVASEAKAGEEAALPWAGLGVAVVVAALGAVALRRLRATALDTVAAGALLFAGVAHCALTPSHWAEGWHLGLFFAASGGLLAAQAVVVGFRPSPAVYASVLASTVAFLVLYVLAREITLPFIDHRDPYLVTDVPVKVAEATAGLLAGLALVRASVRRRTLVPAPVAAHPVAAVAP